ncbi:hypothetical protein SAMN05216308_11120 [Nitrosospira sp. Nsp13]|nr:hypothetical protein SAMN05216308_11120 [Nitrosospira sp. Nsp13]
MIYSPTSPREPHQTIPSIGEFYKNFPSYKMLITVLLQKPNNFNNLLVNHTPIQRVHKMTIRPNK